MSAEDRIAGLKSGVAQAIASANVLFEQPSSEETKTHALIHRELLDAFVRCLRSIRAELDLLSTDPATARRYREVVADSPDSIDYANHLMGASGRRSFAGVLRQCVWDVIRERLHASGTDDEAASDSRLLHALEHACRLFEVGLSVPADYLALLHDLNAPTAPNALPRLDPTGLGAFEGDANAVRMDAKGLTTKMLGAIREQIKSQDIFAGGRTFRPVHDEILPGQVADARSLDNFYGYKTEQAILDEHFKGFAEGETVQPLLMSGMPGVGKTHLSIAHALSLPGAILINAEQEFIAAPLERLFDRLGGHPYRRFVLLFDDVEPEHINWSTFRNHIDGYLPHTDNVGVVITTNGEFPAQIRSRCRVFEFRPMSPEVCMEFISDYLEVYKWMSQPYPDLVSTVAADYASMFSRNLLNDLTPRSLVRYLEMLEGDKEKIRKLIRESLGEVVRIPTEDPFLESNRQIKERLARERRGELGLPQEPAEPVVKPFFGGADEKAKDGRA